MSASARLPHTPPGTHRSLARWALAWLAGLLLALGAASPAQAQASAVPASILGSPVKQVAAGGNHVCALTAEGAVYCWGDNSSYQLGNGSSVDASTPQPVTGLGSGVMAIAAGGRHTCAVTTDGKPLCWGANSFGQVGDYTTGTAIVPREVFGLSFHVVAITAGFQHTCALLTTGAVSCWGDNSQAQVGDGLGGYNVPLAWNIPRQVRDLTSGVAAISAGENHTCALTQAGAVLCWGLNNAGSLGNGSGAMYAVTPEPVTGLSSGVAAIDAGAAHTCARTTAGAAWCWGWNFYGQLGTGNTTSADTPQPLPGLASGVAAIAAGERNTCAITTAGALLCWGVNDYGQLGAGTTGGSVNTPQAVPGLASGVAAVDLNHRYTCAATTAGALQCWGMNTNGHLGNGTTTDANTPQPVAVLGGALVSAAAGNRHSCAISAAGGLHCWGQNLQGQFGNGNNTDSWTAQPAGGMARGVAAVAPGHSHTCALTTAGAVHCWGENTQGQLGDNSTANRNTPVAVQGLPGAVKAIAAGYALSCALTDATGEVYCWGANNFGQAGDGNAPTDATTAQRVQNLPAGAKAIAAGNHHACAITAADALVCWGRNFFGQLGDGTNTNASTAQAVPSLASGVAAIGMANDTTCAVTTAGAVLCWGNNSSGQLGDGTTTNANTPQQVPNLTSGVASVGAGLFHACARTTAGAVWCWGGNSSGELGNGSTANSSTPVAVQGLASGVQALTVGGSYNCALTAGGALQCWGDNGLGKLGNGNTTSRNLPTPIATGQTIAFAAPVPLPAQGTSSTTLAATATSGMAVQFTSVTPYVCSVSGDTLTVLPNMTDGWCGVQASQSGGTNAQHAGYAAAPPQLLLLRVQLGLPDAPTATAATAGETSATVRWTAPAYTGGRPLTGYTVTTVENTAKTCSVTTGSPLPTTCTVPGLTNGTPYTFTVRATNAVGDSVESAPTSPAVRPAEAPTGGGGPATVTINSSGTTTITDPTQPITVGAGAAGAVIALPGTGTTPVTLQLAVNGQSMSVTALPGTQLQVAQVKGQTVLVLVVLQGSASMTSTAPGQPMSLAGEVLLSSGAAGTRIDAQPLAVAVVTGSLVPPAGSLPALGDKGLMAGERLQVDAAGKLVAITLGSIKGDGTQPGDAMVFANLPNSITVDGKVFARIAGTVPRLSGANLTQGLEVTASGVLLLRDGNQVLQLLPTQPITIDARLPDGVSFTPLGLLRWVRGGVVVQFAPAVADLAGLTTAVTAVLPDAKLKLGAEGVIQLTTGGATYVLRPDWTGAGTTTGAPSIGLDAQGRIYLQIGTGAKQLLLPALLSPTQAQALFTAALPGSALALRSGSSDGSLTLTLGGTQWRLVPQWVLPTGNDAAQTTPWRLGADGVLYLKLGTQVQGVKIAD